MKIAVASGKGGTGKTTVVASLAAAGSRSGKKIAFLDCDVEAPNAHLFLQPNFYRSQNVNLLIPKVDEARCTACGQCADVCQFHAIVVLGKKAMVFPELCHGCGSCTLNCPEQAISEAPHVLGVLEGGFTQAGINFSRGVLNIGQPMAVPVIHQLQKWQDSSSAALTVIDSPPGTSCPVVESIRGADFVLLVTEPTPFGLHDLKLAIQLTRKIDLPVGVIINRDGIGDQRVEEYCREENLPIMMRIPFDREIGAGIASGKLLIDIRPDFTERFQHMIDKIHRHLKSVPEVYA